VNGVTLTWNEADAENVTYAVYRDGEAYAKVETNAFDDADVSLGETYTYDVYTVHEWDGESIARADGPGSATIAVPMLGKVQNLNAMFTSDTEASLTWDPVDDATGYEIYRAPVDGEPDLIEIVPDNAYIDASVEAGEEYDYQIIAITEFNGKEYAGEPSDVVRAVRGNPASFTEAGFSYEAGGVDLAWEGMEGATGYILLRDGEEIAELTADTTSYFDDTVELGKTYVYGLKTCYATSIDGPMTVTMETPLPEMPAEIALRHFGSYTDVDFAEVEYADAYKIYRAVNGGEFECVQTVAAEGLAPNPAYDSELLNVKDTVPALETTYTYKVSAVINFNGVDYEGECSDAASVTFGPKPVLTSAEYNLADSLVMLTWEPSEMDDVRGYSIFRREEGSDVSYSIAMVGADETSCADSDIEPGKTYYYSISVLRGDGEDGPSDEVKVTVPGYILYAPDVTYVSHIYDIAEFGFFPGYADAYNVYRAANGGEYELVQTIDIDDLEYKDDFAIISDKVPALETTYTYKLTTVINYNGTAYESEPTDEKTLYFGNVPEIISAEYSITDGAVNLTWEASKRDDVEYYTVYRSAEDERSFYEVAEVDATVTAYADTSVELGKTYVYTISARCSDGVDGPGEEVSVTAQGLTEVPAVHLSYTDNVTHIAWTQVADADYYEIWRSVEMGEYEQIMTTELLTGTT
ncbi:MAG: hypothetical protein IJB18_07435, partial [Clostridia bacterium]|nr:hypothetical protein [Clostridia bacterium]